MAEKLAKPGNPKSPDRSAEPLLGQRPIETEDRYASKKGFEGFTALSRVFFILVGAVGAILVGYWQFPTPLIDMGPLFALPFMAAIGGVAGMILHGFLGPR